MNRRCRRAGHERGSGTLLIAAVTLLVMVLAGVGVLLAGYVAAQHAAAGAADLSALSGAAASVRGQDACAAAGGIARANRVRLTSCKVFGDSFDFVVKVTVVRQLRAPPGLPATVTASAEAGRLAGG
jgi:secretion/DNA translocation related TadE-like protein